MFHIFQTECSSSKKKCLHVAIKQNLSLAALICYLTNISASVRLIGAALLIFRNYQVVLAPHCRLHTGMIPSFCFRSGHQNS